MRSYSSPQSANDLEPTWFATLETVFSVSIYILICFIYGSFRYLLTAVVLAPLMLLRTDESSKWAIFVWSQAKVKVMKYLHSENYLSKNIIIVKLMIQLLQIYLALTGVVLRVIATFYFFIRDPLKLLKSIPQNWFRQCMCTDFKSPPEILPMEQIVVTASGRLPFYQAWKEAMEEDSRINKISMLFSTLPFWIIVIIPSMLYRITFKATSIVYLPLIFAVNNSLIIKMPADVRLERFTKGALEKVRRWYSGIIIGFILYKVGFLLGIVDQDFLNKAYLSPKFVTLIRVTDSNWVFWHITFGIEAVITFALWFYADVALVRLNSKKMWEEKTVLNVVSVISFIRWSVSIVTVLVLLSYVLRYLMHH